MLAKVKEKLSQKIYFEYFNFLLTNHSKDINNKNSPIKPAVVKTFLTIKKVIVFPVVYLNILSIDIIPIQISERPMLIKDILSFFKNKPKKSKTNPKIKDAPVAAIKKSCLKKF